MEADFDFTPVIREWVKSVPNELDFVTERDNMLRVSKVLLHTHYSVLECVLSLLLLLVFSIRMRSITIIIILMLRCYYTHIILCMYGVGY